MGFTENENAIMVRLRWPAPVHLRVPADRAQGRRPPETSIRAPLAASRAEEAPNYYSARSSRLEAQ